MGTTKDAFAILFFFLLITHHALLIVKRSYSKRLTEEKKGEVSYKHISLATVSTLDSRIQPATEREILSQTALHSCSCSPVLMQYFASQSHETEKFHTEEFLGANVTINFNRK